MRHYGSPHPAPRGIDLDLHPGETLLVLGPSGCGKSTLALAACGLIPHAIPASVSGNISVSGLEVSLHSSPALAPRVGIVFQDPDAQIVTTSVLDEVCFGPENLCLEVPEILYRAELALRAVGLWDRREEDPELLSGGGKQRLAIACALAMRPPLIVLDEPTANLDPAGAEEVYAALRDITKLRYENEATSGSEPSAILLIEHNLDACASIVDRVLVLDAEGSPAMIGTRDEVLRERGAEVAELGVWLPSATRAAQRLLRAGISFAPMPLTTSELSLSLNAQSDLPSPHGHATSLHPYPRFDERDTARTEGQSVGHPAEHAPVVSVRELTLRRGRRDVLQNVSFEVMPREFLAVVGPNGAGKTSLIQAIAGVIRAPRGSVAVAGLDPAIDRASAVAAHVGFVFQNPEHQFICDTVEDELAHGLRVLRRSHAEIASEVDRVLAKLGLSHLRRRHPYQLSGGQKRRLSVGTALIGGATVLVLDEPTFGQDQEKADALMALLHELRGSGTTVIAVTHDLQLVADHASSVAVLSGGNLIAHGSTADILRSDALLRAGLRPPPLAEAMRALTRHPAWQHITKLSELPGESS